MSESLRQQFEPEYSEAKRRLGNKIRAKVGLKKKPDLNWKKERGIKEDARYDPTPGGHEWGTPQGTDYFKSLTPGQSNPKEDAVKPLDIKARKPEDEKGVKVTEGYWEDRKKKDNKTLAKHDKAMIDSARKSIKKYEDKKSLAKRITENLDLSIDLSSIEPNQADHSKHMYPIVNDEEQPDIDKMLTGRDGDWYIDNTDIIELEKEAENITFDKAVELGLYDPEEVANDDFDDDPYDVEQWDITEALSVQGRLKRRFNARRNKQKLKVARNIALRRGSTPDRLKRRATRGARLMVYKRLLRGRDRGSLPPAEKARLERMIKRFAPLVSRISVKLLPQMRKNEIRRLTQRGKKRPSHSKRYKAAKPIRGAASQKAKRYKIGKPGKYKQPKKPKYKAHSRSGGPTLKKASKAYKAFSYSVG